MILGQIINILIKSKKPLKSTLMHCIIPCRAGSKRIPRKALELFNGVPMLQDAIEKAKSINIIKNIFVSTDDTEFGDLATRCGAIFLPRSKELSNDFIGVDQTLGEVSKDLIKKNLISLSDYVLTLFPCTPLLSSKSINQFCNEFLNKKFKTGLIISKYRHPIQRALSKTQEGYITIDNELAFEKRTQDLEEKFHDAGQCYLTEASTLINGKLIDDKPYGYIDNDVLDIDNLDDLEFARKIIKIK